jgi:aspartyl protease family protein
MIYVACVLFLAFGTWFFSAAIEDRRNPNQDIATRVEAGVREVTLERNRQGHFVASGTINGEPVTFMLDTGASDVSIPASVADRIGLERGAQVRYNTANGVVNAYRTRLDEVGIGDIRVRDIRGSINPHVQFDQVLLGNSFLEEVEFTQTRQKLILRQAASR